MMNNSLNSKTNPNRHIVGSMPYSGNKNNINHNKCKPNKNNNHQHNNHRSQEISSQDVKSFLNFIIIPGLVIFGLYWFINYAGQKPLDMYNVKLYVLAFLLSVFDLVAGICFYCLKNGFPKFKSDGVPSTLFAGLVIVVLLSFFNAALVRVINSSLDKSESQTNYVKVLDAKSRVVVSHNKGSRREREYYYITVTSWFPGRESITFETTRNVFCNAYKGNIFRVVDKKGLLGMRYILKFNKVSADVPDNSRFPMSQEEYDKAINEQKLIDQEKRRKKKEAEEERRQRESRRSRNTKSYYDY